MFRYVYVLCVCECVCMRLCISLRHRARVYILDQRELPADLAGRCVHERVYVCLCVCVCVYFIVYARAINALRNQRIGLSGIAN